MGKLKTERPDFGGEFPEHLAIIMDGNGRWAQRRALRRVLGHKQGINSVREITTECARMGVKSLTLYAFSVENWKRPSAEVRFLMKLLKEFMVEERPTLMDNEVQLHCIGRLDDIEPDALVELRKTEELTRGNTGMRLRLALSYGGRTEIADGIRAMCEDAQAGKLDPKSIDEESLRAYLYDPETPDPDLLIRTAGEMRISNFLLWQISYSELFVTEKCWPEFRKDELIEALTSYASRVRKFGGLVADLPPEPGDKSPQERSA
ncbi:MAG: undecaprenyl diphosphate synthase [Planctomycetota bacterium]|jgi:undecaprenyl diphosphate synthase